ncbi:MAG: NAD-dependent epimerase/dehydratase family protein [Planctomycetota bacterium]
MEALPRPRRWLVTGAAGFIGSHLVEALLARGEEVRGLDDLSTGRLANLDDVRARVGEERWRRFSFAVGDVGDPAACREACAGVDVVLHQAARGAVPRSLADPLAAHAANCAGFVSVLEAVRAAGCARLVYASSSSVYGDSRLLPRREEELGVPLSPYAATKRADELYAAAWHRAFGVPAIGLRYFNVFGPRQDPAGPYAAVLPRWTLALLCGERPVIHGDGTTSRDFTAVADIVRANLLAAEAGPEAVGGVYNVGSGEEVDLGTALAVLRAELATRGVDCAGLAPRHDALRPGDVPRSRADLERARRGLGFRPAVGFAAGVREMVAWFVGAYGPRGTGRDFPGPSLHSSGGGR